MWHPRGEFEAFSLPFGFLIFKYTLEEDMLVTLEGGPWFIHRKLLALKRWSSRMKLEKISISTYYSLYGSRFCIYHWISRVLQIGKIISRLAKPLYMDKPFATKTRIGYTHICVKMYVGAGLPGSLAFIVRNTQHLIKFEYGWKPTRCPWCYTFGHTDTKFPLLVKKETSIWIIKKPTSRSDLAKEPCGKTNNVELKTNKTSETNKK
ncbi:hypothetical protein Cni_G02270 [Canna indica]|uniref:DUF4283 domain-containing protein n=1 Tax=Canna indica TaxID=4628 RepID=A0AAQ3PZK7_9LILI|nr:hypothetical protein Cni_G02270 [Canna indica]